MTTATVAATEVPRFMKVWIELGLGLVAVAASWGGLSSFDYERYLSPTFLAQWLTDAGPLAPLPTQVLAATNRTEIPLRIRCTGCGAAIPSA